ncbi:MULTISPECIES: hypothetical protein [unclassified Streptomyces]|uniref:Lipoprotein n=1 Tax=Streptomyces sp. NBC_00060 TaxID=2975636 RepID=A0AAU2GU19_9ACTN
MKKPGLCTAVAVGAVLCAAGCGTGEGPGPGAGPARADIAAAASAIGCAPHTTLDADELREATCTKSGTRYRVTAFATSAGREAWLEESRAYGGSYLVGARWVVVARPESALSTLREKLGGELEAAAQHAHMG